MAPLLEVRNLNASFFLEDGELQVLRDVSFYIDKGETLGLVGESGCGKSVTALSIMRLLSKPGRVTSGEIYFEGRNLLDLSEREMRKIRGNNIAMIFQEPMTSLNPVFTVGEQIAEAIRLHQGLSRRDAMKEAAKTAPFGASPSRLKRSFVAIEGALPAATSRHLLIAADEFETISQPSVTPITGLMNMAAIGWVT